MDPQDILPSEIWSIIFSFITKRKDIGSLLQTCHLFQDLVYHAIIHIDRVITCLNTNKFTINVVKRFKSLQRIKIKFSLDVPFHIAYVSKLKLKEVKFMTNCRFPSELVHQFILENPQLDSFIIQEEQNRNQFILEKNILYIFKLNELFINQILNPLKNLNITTICASYGNNLLNLLNPRQYKIKLYLLTEENIHLLTKPFEIELCNNNPTMKKYINPCLIPHRLCCKYSMSYMDNFEIFLENLKYNFPKSDLTEVIYDRTSYLKIINYRHVIDLKQKNAWLLEMNRDICNKPYKII